MLALSAWDSWSRLQAVHRIAAVTDASAHLFKALHNLRIDRASSYRDLMADRQFTAMAPQIKEAREAEMLALKSALAALQTIDFPDRPAMVGKLDQSIRRLAALHDESAPA